MAILNRYKYIIVSVLMIISILSINIIKPKAELYDSINLVNNGNFSNGTTGWYGSRGNVSIVSGNLRGTSNGTRNYSTIYTRTSIGTAYANDKIYLRFKVRVNNNSAKSIELKIQEYYNGSLIRNSVMVQIVKNPINDQWYEINNVYTLTKNIDFNHLEIQILDVYTDSTTSNGKTHEIKGGTDGVILVNLTNTFGAGNEPNLIDCQRIYSEYFEGLKRQDIKPHDEVENAHKTVIQMIVSTMLVPINMLKSYRIGNQISLFDIFIGMIILFILTKTILKIGGRTSNDVR